MKKYIYRCPVCNHEIDAFNGSPFHICEGCGDLFVLQDLVCIEVEIPDDDWWENMCNTYE